MRKLNVQLFMIMIGCMWLLSQTADAVVSKSSGRYQVVGIMGGETDGVAVIFDSESKKTRAFKKGDRISSDLVLSSIDRHEVLLKDITNEELQVLERKVGQASSAIPAAAPKLAEEDSEPVVTVIDAWGRQTEVTLEEYLSQDEDEPEESDVADLKKNEDLEQKYKSLFPSFLSTTGKAIPRLVNSKLKLPVIDPRSDKGLGTDDSSIEEEEALGSELPSKEMLDFYRELEELDQAIEAGDYEE